MSINRRRRRLVRRAAIWAGAAKKCSLLPVAAKTFLRSKLPDDPSYLGTVIEEGAMYHLTGPLNSLSAANLPWSELLDNF